ncbi:hypothetical protein [Streptococcus pacificus]|uniref:HTH cro/C1-type domain-containing protein n=1 Tax=Streptococcus pacificus TaxID=2740577 RepID=A0ABS0ZI77_9STRE|nr:hypothetical protein [Streptococcus pacificus]MBJ8325246.1 hypothetical protein [Streptococcus pacificus]
MKKTYVKDFTSSYIIDGEEIVVTSPARFDSDTHEILYDIELDNIAVIKADEIYRSKFNIVRAEQIKNFRKELNISLKDLGEALHIDEEVLEGYFTFI